MNNKRLRQEAVHQKEIKDGALHEAARRIQVRAETDVVVCGGGPAGAAAAIAAGKEGARVLLIERFGMLGGTWTAGLMNPFFESGGRGWVVDELVERLKKEAAWSRWSWTVCFDTETMRRVLEEMAAEAGVELLYFTPVVDTIVEKGTCRGVVIESKAGREAVLAQAVIDATGDGDVAARAGCPYEFGRLEDGLVQPMTLMFEVRNLPAGYEMTRARDLYDQMAAVIAEHDPGYQLPFPKCNAVPYIINVPTGGGAVVQACHVYRLNPLDPSHLTRGTVQMRSQANKLTGILKKIPGLEHIQLTHTAGALGIRETRRVVGNYYLDYEDLVQGAVFDDGITAAGFPVDIHEPAPGSGIPTKAEAKMRPYEIPYRCLVPRGIKGLLVAGRCISGSHEAHASYRVTGTCAGMGQAAGLAAARAVRDALEVAEINGADLKRTLSERGAQFIQDGYRGSQGLLAQRDKQPEK